MRLLANFAIRFYQKFISPYKGFRCAHKAVHGGDSCSEAVRKIILAQGLFGGYGNIRQRFNDCSAAYQQLQERQRKDKRSCKERRRDCREKADCLPDPGDCIPSKNCYFDSPCDCSLF